MSRIGQRELTLPVGVSAVVDGNVITVKGPKGTLVREFSKSMKLKMEDGKLTVERPDELPQTRALHGTTRALIHNMVEGVNHGFKKTLSLEGVGYRAANKGKGLELALGYSHPIIINEIPGITFTVEKNTTIHIEGVEKETVGQVAANIRAKRPPEPYKGKGIKYEDEHIRRKEGKKA